MCAHVKHVLTNAASDYALERQRATPKALKDKEIKNWSGQMKEISEDGNDLSILPKRKTGREGTLCHLAGIPSGCFCFQDIGCVSGKLPASRESYWITDNLGMDSASTEGVYKGWEGRGESDGCMGSSFTLLFSSVFCSFSDSSYSLIIKSMMGPKLNLSTHLAFFICHSL